MKKDNKRTNWKSLQTKLSAGLTKEQDGIQFRDTPFYPLAFHTELPEASTFEHGHLSFRFNDFSFSDLGNITLDPKKCVYENGKVNLAMHLNSVAMHARYEIIAKFASQITLDTGGNMRDLDESSARSAGASDSGVTPLSQDEIDAMVTQARDQKTPIQGTFHGPTLMSSYNEHSESYNSAFVTSANLRQLWSAGGATTEMSRDTHSALSSNDQVVNSPTKIYANGQSYNYNAASQQVNVSFALTIMASKATAAGNTELAAKYTAAAIAAASFQQTTNATGNGQEPANLTGPEVYNVLNDSSAKMVQISEAEFRNMFDQANDEDSKDGGADAEAIRNGWRILPGDERKMIRERIVLFQEELLALEKMEPEQLWAGECHAELKGTEASVQLVFNEETANWTISDSKVSLPAFSIELDDSFWTGSTADIVRERLSKIHFVKSLLQSKIESAIQQAIERASLQVIAVA